MVTRVQARDGVEDLRGRTLPTSISSCGASCPYPVPSDSVTCSGSSAIPRPSEYEELDEADLVLAASSRLASHLSARTSTPVEVLLQGTDHRRFRPVAPDPAMPMPSRSSPTRVVRSDLSSPTPSVRGSGPPCTETDGSGSSIAALIVQRHVPNGLLPIVYSSAHVVLNDHWGR